jgi:hypothetical protein
VKVERVAGLMATVLAIGGALFALFAPLNSNEECSGAVDGPPACSSYLSSYWQDDRVDASRALGVIGSVALLAGFGAVVDTRGAKRHRALLFSATAVLMLMTFLTIFSVGPMLLPATLGALVSSIVALIRHDAICAA